MIKENIQKSIQDIIKKQFYTQVGVEIFYPKDMIELPLAEKDNKIIAGMLLFKYKKRVSAEFAVSDKIFQKFSPNHFLFWNAIKISIREGFEIFDFGQTSPANKGLMKFKKRWGSEVVDLPHLYYPKESFAGNGTRNEDTLKYRIIKKSIGIGVYGGCDTGYPCLG